MISVWRYTHSSQHIHCNKYIIERRDWKLKNKIKMKNFPLCTKARVVRRGWNRKIVPFDSATERQLANDSVFCCRCLLCASQGEWLRFDVKKMWGILFTEYVCASQKCQRWQMLLRYMLYGCRSHSCCMVANEARNTKNYRSECIYMCVTLLQIIYVFYMVYVVCYALLYTYTQYIYLFRFRLYCFNVSKWIQSEFQFRFYREYSKLHNTCVLLSDFNGASIIYSTVVRVGEFSFSFVCQFAMCADAR